MRPFPPRALLAASVAMGLVVSGAGAGAMARPQAPDVARESGPDELVQALEAAWLSRSLEGLTALWAFESEGKEEIGLAAFREALAGEETRLSVLGRPRALEGGEGARWATDVQVFSATEPRARVDSWRLFMERRDGQWLFVEKEAQPGMEGLMHLPMGEKAWRARGVVLRLEDFELRLEDGTLFPSAESVGRTAFVFVGRARVRFAPQPEAEREQLRQFSGDPALDRAVKWAFIRLQPEEFPTLVDITRLEPDPNAGRRRDEAVRRWSERAPRSFMVDADLPGSPWWLPPGPGDVLVDFPWKRGRVLTLAMAPGEEEDVNLFERDNGLRICSYASRDHLARRGQDRPETVDVIHHDLSVSFDDERQTVEAVDTLRVRLLASSPTISLKLHDDFRVRSVTSGDGRSLFFLRVREQGSLVVSLGPHAHRQDELTLTVRYGGRHHPGTQDQEMAQVQPDLQSRLAEEALLSSQPLVYSNRTAWYPQTAEPDYSTLDARFDTRDGVSAVTGGELRSTSRSEGRVVSEYSLGAPGKFFTAVVGRFDDVGTRQGSPKLQGFAAPRTRGDADEGLDSARALVAFYESLFGPCPYPAINVATVLSATPGGHSPPGLVVLWKGSNLLGPRALPDDPAHFSGQPDFFLAHELAHQWFGQGVAPASYRDQWISEAWAQYAAALWAEHQGGEEAFRDMLAHMARWARRHHEEGPIDLGQRLGHLKGDPRVRRALVYDKGALVLHMLRRIIGDEPFFRGARVFLDAHRYGHATTADLRRALEEASGRALGPYFESWVYGTTLPVLEWTRSTRESSDGFETTVQVRPRHLPAPVSLEIAVRTRDESLVRRVMLGPEGGTWTVVSPGPVRDVWINRDQGILAEEKRVRRLEAPQR